MEPHHWILALAFILALIYAVAEAASKLISKHRIQILLDNARSRSLLQRHLLPEMAGSLRSHLNLGRLLFLLLYVTVALHAYHGNISAMLLYALCGIGIIYYLPIVFASVHPRKALKAALPVILLFAAPLSLIVGPRDAVFNSYRSRSRQQTVSKPEDEDEEDEHIRAYIGEAEEEGLFEPDEAEMVRQVIEFSDTVVREIMTPRVNMECVDKTMTIEAFVNHAADLKYSRYPVIDGKIDNVSGIIHIKSLLSIAPADYADTTVGAVLLPAHFVPESKKVSLLLRDFQASKQQLAVVVDEYGGTAGIITLEDILEEIVGEIEDEHEDEDEHQDAIIQHTDGSLTVSGNVDVSEIEKILDETMDDDSYETVSGFALNHLKHIPESGETFITPGGIEVEILDADEKSITKVKLKKVNTDE